MYLCWRISAQNMFKLNVFLVETEMRKASVPSLKRRSSVARSIRRSQSTTGPPGFTFEQQVKASTGASGNITFEEKICKIVSLSLSATVKTLQQENEQIEIGANHNIDDVRADLIDHLVSRSGRNALLNENDVKKISTNINHLKNIVATKKKDGLMEHKSAHISSARLRTLKQYQDSLNKEINDWDELLQQRKNKYNSTKVEYQMIAKGETKITNSHRTELPRLEEAWLRGLSDGRAELSRLKRQEVMMELSEQRIFEKIARKRKALYDKDVVLDQLAKSISKTASLPLLDNLETTCVGIANDSSLKPVEPKQYNSSSQAGFAQELDKWVQEMQSL